MNHPSLTTRTPDVAVGPDPESDRLWSELADAKQRYEQALRDYLAHHNLAADQAA